MNLKDRNVSFMIINENINDVNSYLYSRKYNIIDICRYFEGKSYKSIMAYSGVSNEELRRDAIHLSDIFGQSIIVKYRDSDMAIKISKNSILESLDILIYGEFSNDIYMYEGFSFSFQKQPTYFFPLNKEDINNGMIVEYLYNNQWNKMDVVDVDVEYDKMYKLLIKYNKLRIPLP